MTGNGYGNDGDVLAQVVGGWYFAGGWRLFGVDQVPGSCQPHGRGICAGFLLSFSMSGTWRAVAGAVAEGTTPIIAVGDSLLRMPVAT